MRPMNPWENPDRLPPEEAAALASFIEGRGRLPEQSGHHDALVAAIAPQPGARMLDLGCGTGPVTRRLATLVGDGGSVLGVDVSAAMLRVARDAEIMPTLRYELGDTAALPYPDASFDGAAAARLLLHLPDPLPTLTEARRLVRPGGRLGLLEWDLGTLIVDLDDRALLRKVLSWRADSLDGDNWMARQLPRLLLRSGWSVQSIVPRVTIARDATAQLVGSLRYAGDMAAKHGAIDGGELAAWHAAIDERLAEGTFFASSTDFVIVAI